MPDEPVEKYEVAGVDDRERGFNRQVLIHRESQKFLATLRYETVHISSELGESAETALEQLIHKLHDKGYRQVRSRLSFRGDEYFGSQELWVEYPDPTPPSWISTVIDMFRQIRKPKA